MRIARCIAVCVGAVVTAAAVSLAGPADPAACPADLTSYWTFDDGTAADPVGGHGGGAVGATVDNNGFIGKAFHFDGNDSIDVPWAPALEPAVFTIEAWIRGDTWSNCQFGFCTIVATGDSDATPSGYYLVIDNDGRARFGISHGPGGVEATQIISPDPLPLGAWVHIAFTGDGAITRMYLDGVEVGAAFQTRPIFYEHQPFQIGAGVARYFRGSIDEVAIHDRALSASEIQQHHANGLAGDDYCAPLDFDGDGVPDDGTDLCPNTPAAEAGAVDAHGCGPSQRDTDGDGVADSLDACVTSPAADLAFVGQTAAFYGCGPALVCAGVGDDDPDHDGFAYAVDVCPWTDRAGAPAQPIIDGCSCAQILQYKPGDNANEQRRGCSAETLRDFRNRVGWALRLPRPPT